MTLTPQLTEEESAAQADDSLAHLWGGGADCQREPAGNWIARQRKNVCFLLFKLVSVLLGMKVGALLLLAVYAVFARYCLIDLRVVLILSEGWTVKALEHLVGPERASS